MDRVVLVAFAVTVIVGVLSVAVLDRRWARQRREQMSRALERSETRAAFNELMAAQTLFTAEVLRYEAALEAKRVEPGQVRIDLYAPGQQPPVADLEQMKEWPRKRLLAAKAAWENVRPSPVLDAGPPRWVGFGEIRTWGLGVFGRERAFLRFEHASDPSIWVTLEVSRSRIGLGVGAEVQRIGALAEHADPSVLLAMVRTSLDHTDFAIRPGFHPVATARALRQRRSTFQRLMADLRVRGGTAAMWKGSTDTEADDDRRALDAIVSIDPDHVEPVNDLDEIDLRVDVDPPGILRCSTAGPSIMLGWWRTFGDGDFRLLGRSPHGEWSRRLDASGQQVPEPESSGRVPTRSTLSDVATNSQV